MKRLFAKASKPFTVANKPLSEDPGGRGQTTTPASTLVHTPGLQAKYVVPPLPHPCPHAYLEILAGNDGLLLRPNIPELETTETPGSFIRIPWRKAVTIEEVESTGKDLDWSESSVIYGIVGILELYSCSYLLVITSRTDSGSLLDESYKVFGVKGVVAIPLLEDRAKSVVQMISSRNSALARPSLLPRSSTVAGGQEDAGALDSVPVPASPHVQFLSDPQVKLVTPIRDYFEAGDLRRPESPHSTSSTASTPSSEQYAATPVLKAVATRLSFWNRKTKGDINVPQSSEVTETEPIPMSETLDKVIQEARDKPTEVISTILATTAPPPATIEQKHNELEGKVIRECIREFTKGDMYFSYTFDLTRSLEHKQERLAKSHKEHELLAGLGALPSQDSDFVGPEPGTKVSAIAEPYPALPLWRRVDKQFWWNEWMSKHFIDAGLHSYILPIMQGYFQTASFVAPSELGEDGEECHVDYTIISRRSRDRAGLRYQRRGVDEEAHVANFVETETIMRVERDGKENIFSYIQIRGSIPLFWTQTGYGLKPPPVLASDRTHEQNLDAIGRHLKRTLSSYGPHTIVNLAEQGGKEGAITQAYREYVKELGLPNVHYQEYDFHKETKGMKYENISKLIDAMERVFETQGKVLAYSNLRKGLSLLSSHSRYFWICDNTVLSQQKGVFRVNCIDCLDRTNVVQSAFARHTMYRQLGALALLNSMSPKRPDIEFTFNDVWANNGDAISRAYAGTSALKGDFTRTGRRDLSGLLNDGVNSLARMYTSTFSDWFCQAVIDFALGNRTLSVFSEFLLKLQSSDPRDLIRLSKIRTEAIATSVARILPEGEGLLSGWTLFSPEELNTKLGLKFEEKVLLLTMKALYVVSYDYTLEKVKLYTRVPLGDIVGISRGAYILSPLEETSRDPEHNAGFVITWTNANQESRVSSYCVQNSINSHVDPSAAPTPRKASLASFPLQIQTWNASRKLPANLSRLLANPALASVGTGERMFAAFKALPVDPTRMRQGSGTTSGPYSETSEEIAGAATCREVIDRIVESISRACKDIGVSQAGFIADQDVVSLEEAQRTTTMYAKMEYGVKRLLWLGG
ncbi:hypothetical protein NP233_g298 [Leucocoprinus birnbaumii]|uniref:SAC domain-containing protein n=1 Tax=Leucocoprinus birnbaumii TaxID=56174 RepID=A0AAD5W495_9AGAR|nr:hypothetical protein NP233_g298 [Leucocoprinus birnbaumii]